MLVSIGICIPSACTEDRGVICNAYRRVVIKAFLLYFIRILGMARHDMEAW